jgi:hypothetical protein
VGRTTSLSLTLLSLALAPACPACSGSAPSSLLYSPLDGGHGSADDGATVSTGPHGPGDTGGPGSDSGLADSGSGADSGSPVDSGRPGPSVDSGPGPGVDAGVQETGVIDSGGGAPGVACPMGGQAVLCQAGDICCITGISQGMQGTQVDTCQNPTAPCSGTPVHCASSADCPSGETCCGTQTNAGFRATYRDVSCQTSCFGPMSVTFCDPRVGGGCPPGMQCAASALLQGFSACR